MPHTHRRRVRELTHSSVQCDDNKSNRAREKHAHIPKRHDHTSSTLIKNEMFKGYVISGLYCWLFLFCLFSRVSFSFFGKCVHTRKDPSAGLNANKITNKKNEKKIAQCSLLCLIIFKFQAIQNYSSASGTTLCTHYFFSRPKTENKLSSFVLISRFLCVHIKC